MRVHQAECCVSWSCLPFWPRLAAWFSCNGAPDSHFFITFQVSADRRRLRRLVLRNSRIQPLRPLRLKKPKRRAPFLISRRTCPRRQMHPPARKSNPPTRRRSKKVTQLRRQVMLPPQKPSRQRTTPHL